MSAAHSRTQPHTSAVSLQLTQAFTSILPTPTQLNVPAPEPGVAAAGADVLGATLVDERPVAVEPALLHPEEAPAELREVDQVLFVPARKREKKRREERDEERW